MIELYENMQMNNKSLIEALVKAIQAEIEGQNFYMMSARSTDDQKGKEIFTQLAAEETEHAAYLKGQYKSIIETGAPDKTLKLGSRLQLTGSSPIFSAKIKSRVKDAHYEMTALSIGIQLELNAIKFYKEQAEAAEDATVKQLFTELADWESGHYHALLKQLDYLQEDYWNAAGFAPF